VCQPSALARSASVERVRRASSRVTGPKLPLGARQTPSRRPCQLPRLASEAGLRRRFCAPRAPPRPRRRDGPEGVPLNVIQRQLRHADLGVTSVYLQGIDNAEVINAVHAPPSTDGVGERRPPPLNDTATRRPGGRARAAPAAPRSTSNGSLPLIAQSRSERATAASTSCSGVDPSRPPRASRRLRQPPCARLGLLGVLEPVDDRVTVLAVELGERRLGLRARV
jgi:hypothetical protein